MFICDNIGVHTKYVFYERQSMKEFSIITDSCCSLNADEAAELGITVLPLTFTLDGETYLDTPDHSAIAPEEFYRKIAAGGKCFTAGVNVDAYMNAMNAAVKAGKSVLCICFSGALSCTFNNARLAAEYIREEDSEADIEVIDSLCACRGLGMLIYRTVKEQKVCGLSMRETAEFVMRERNRQAHWFFVDDLNHLQRGGRIKRIEAVAGSILGIKPVIHCDADGKLTIAGKVRGLNNAIKALADKIRDAGVQANQTIFISHANCVTYVQKIVDMLNKNFGITDIHTDFICPVIGAHTGCGTLGLFFVANRR